MTSSFGTLELRTTADGSKTYYSSAYQETFHSIHGALTESQTIFIDGTRISDKLASVATSADNLRNIEPLRVLEIGFGLGLNFLLAADIARHHHARLDYWAVEQELMGSSELLPLGYHKHLKHPGLANETYSLLAHFQKQVWQQNTPQSQESQAKRRLAVTPEISLTFVPEIQAVESALPHSNDVIFLDAFSPDSNQECWENSVLQPVTRSLKKDGILATYSAKGIIRRRLESCGLTINKVPGPPGKREFITASWPEENR